MFKYQIHAKALLNRMSKRDPPQQSNITRTIPVVPIRLILS